MRMKWFIYAGVAIGLLSVACQDITVGYLKADYGAYPIGKMEIYDIPVRIQELQEKKVLFSESPLKAEYDQKKEIAEAMQKNKELFSDTVKSVRDSITRLEDSKDEADIQLVKELQEKLEDQLIPREDELRNIWNASLIDLQKAEKALDNYAYELGIPAFAVLEEQIEKLEYMLRFEVPWVTPEIEGVEGTEPLIYEIVRTKGPDPEAVEKFMDYTEIIGGGRISVKQEVVANVPAGEYVVTVRVHNEEREKVFPDAFTFVITK